MSLMSTTMTNRTYPSIAAVTSGLIWCVDASQAASYPIAGGTVWYDISGGGRNATLVNGAAYDNSLGASIQFSGTATKKYATATIPSTAITNITIQAWVNRSTTDGGSVFRVGNSSVGYSIGFGVAEGYYDNPAPYLSGLFSGIRWLPTTATVGTGSWNLISMTLSATSVATIYLNGVAISTPTGTAPGAPTTSISLASNTGNNSSDTVYFFNGKIGAAFMYNRALSAAEILTTYNSLAIRFGLIGQP